VSEVAGQEVSSPTAPAASTSSENPELALDAADLVTNALEDPSLRNIVREVLERNPSVAGAAARARAARQVAPQVKALPDPMVGATGYLSPPETRVGPQRLVATLSQRFPWFGKLDLREQAALQQAEALDANVESRRLDLVTEVRRLVYEIAFLDAFRTVIETDRETLIHYEQGRDHQGRQPPPRHRHPSGHAGGLAQRAA
jgi:outer membrane protein TolC